MARRRKLAASVLQRRVREWLARRRRARADATGLVHGVLFAAFVEAAQPSSTWDVAVAQRMAALRDAAAAVDAIGTADEAAKWGSAGLPALLDEWCAKWAGARAKWDARQTEEAKAEEEKAWGAHRREAAVRSAKRDLKAAEALLEEVKEMMATGYADDKQVKKAEEDVARATAALAAAEAGERGPLQSQRYFRRRAEFEAEGLDDDSILEAMGEERMIESGRWEAGYAGFGH